MAKKTEGQASAAVTFGKAQALAFKRYSERKDLLSVLLEDGKSYSMAEIDAAIDRFMKRKVT